MILLFSSVKVTKLYFLAEINVFYANLFQVVELYKPIWGKSYISQTDLQKKYIYTSTTYSDLSAITGSFLDAICAGIKPAIKVRNILIATSITAPKIGKLATF